MWKVRFLYVAYSQGKDFELILTVKMETRHPIEGYFVSEFQRSVIIAELWWPEVARPGNFVSNFCAFFGKKTSYIKIFKILFRKFSPPHRSPLFCPNFVKRCGREIGEIVRIYWTEKKFSRLSNCWYCADRAQNLSGHIQQCTQSAPDYFGSLSAEL